jgi:peptidyl-tRNA hydrolase ICT1
MANAVVRVSSKATLRIPIHSLLPLLPKLLHPHILNSRYHAARSNDVVIQADDARKQNENVNSCFRRLHELVVDAGRAAVPGETSQDTVKRVEQLQKAEKAQRRKAKEHQSKKKSARRGGGGRDE